MQPSCCMRAKGCVTGSRIVPLLKSDVAATARRRDGLRVSLNGEPRRTSEHLTIDDGDHRLLVWGEHRIDALELAVKLMPNILE